MLEGNGREQICCDLDAFKENTLSIVSVLKAVKVLWCFNRSSLVVFLLKAICCFVLLSRKSKSFYDKGSTIAKANTPIEANDYEVLPRSVYPKIFHKLHMSEARRG